MTCKHRYLVNFSDLEKTIVHVHHYDMSLLFTIQCLNIKLKCPHVYTTMSIYNDSNLGINQNSETLLTRVQLKITHAWVSRVRPHATLHCTGLHVFSHIGCL